MKNPFAYLKSVRKKLKDPYWRAKCDYIKYYEELPIEENVILLESQSATKVDGNIYAILKYITSDEKYKDYKIYLSSWGRYMKKIRPILKTGEIKNVKLVLYASDEYVRLLASAKYLINDATFPNYYIKKEGQIYLNTWHGTPLKAMGRSVHNDVFFGNVQKNLVSSDYLLYPNVFTKNVMIRDYMLENISSGSYVLGGYPRNEVFFNDTAREILRGQLGLSGKRVYAYMPTWRGTVDKIGFGRNDVYLMYFLYELDRLMNDDEVLYINIHPMAVHAKNDVEIKSLKHIKKFPEKYETYEFLNIADALVTDYSSVFFDYACTRRKIVLFPYDKEEYLEKRGMYLDMDELPFPRVFNIPDLLAELRSEEINDYDKFVEEFCAFDNICASQQLCDRVILGIDTGLAVEKIPNNGKENVLIYAGNLDKNGITTSLRSLTNSLDLDKRNYYISFCQGKAKKHASQLATFNSKVNLFAISENFNLTVHDRVIRKLFNKNIISAKKYMRYQKNRVNQNFRRAYGNARFDMAIQFCGYEREYILMYSAFEGKNAIWVHNDMIAEMKSKGNQRLDILQYAYRNYDAVVPVSDDIISSVTRISNKPDNIITVRNTIDYKTILLRSEEPITLDRTTKCSVSRAKFDEIMKSDCKKFINIGRYSPEKGHDRLVDSFYKLWQDNKDIVLIIMGGNSRQNGYEKLKEKVKHLGLENNVILLLAVSNPYPIVKACDYFIMSSFYEGLPMVLFEAGIMGLPIAATDVSGPHGFLTKYGGALVENSEEGVYNGLKMLLNDEVKALDIDYDAYNAECVEEFEKIFE